MRNNGVRCPFFGISVNRDLSQCLENLDRWWDAVSQLLPAVCSASKAPFEIFDEFIGKQYGDPTEACLDAIVLMAQAEGILLDPVYSGKMFSGFLAHCSQGRWSVEQSVLLLHSGGAPALFAYHEPIEAHLRRRGLLSDSFGLLRQ
jgi:D-cysteine desulfhydrase